MKIAGVVLLAVMAGGCTSVRLEQRDGCWVRQTSRWPKQLKEEIGPCEREKPTWSEDRLTRLAQECMVQADYRWKNRALAAWNQGQPLPEPESEAKVLQFCMNEAAHSVVTENETLKKRLNEVSADRDVLRASEEKDREHLHSSHDRLTDALGEAAKKPPGAAVATSISTSDGTATTLSDSDTSVALPNGAAPGSSPAPRMGVPAPEPMRGRAPKIPVTVEPTPDKCEGTATVSTPFQPSSDSRK
ncbi:hypothetical protein F0U60_22715 [Archangium minus]|uniref:Lipoprotein n=1 Tax=Archangium minus TaxID=83450 RepID=A0ABY9WVX6_9BACT|nr:hypothetical protein F0U61_22820 [Archangium violaceum]WNG46611.1 hypothetical protein F0U60_22715 [Archangium minus]